MGDPCDKGPIIDEVKRSQQLIAFEQNAQNTKMDQILANQLQLGTDIKQAIDGLTKILLADIETRKDVEQLKKDREILFELRREDGAQIARIIQLADRFSGARVLENTQEMWNWYQQHRTAESAFRMDLDNTKTKLGTVHDWYLGEMGWRRFIPATAAVISVLLTIYVSVTTIQNNYSAIHQRPITAEEPKK